MDICIDDHSKFSFVNFYLLNGVNLVLIFMKEGRDKWLVSDFICGIHPDLGVDELIFINVYVLS